jgi:hypothetical protein
MLAPPPSADTDADAFSSHLSVHFVSAIDLAVLPLLPASPLLAQAVFQPRVPEALDVLLVEKG